MVMRQLELYRIINERLDRTVAEFKRMLLCYYLVDLRFKKMKNF